MVCFSLSYVCAPFSSDLDLKEKKRKHNTYDPKGRPKFSKMTIDDVQ